MLTPALQAYAVTPGVGNMFFTPEQMTAIGAAAGPGGRVEMNTFQQFIVHTADPDVDATQARLRALGLAVYPVGSVVKNLRTCTFCMGERTEGLADARALDAAIAGARAPFPVRVAFAGCSSNCGEVLLQDIGVVRMPNGTYDLFAGGRPGSLNPLVAQPVARGIAGDDLPAAVRALLDAYHSQAQGKERVWKLLQRLGRGPLAQALAPFARA